MSDGLPLVIVLAGAVLLAGTAWATWTLSGLARSAGAAGRPARGPDAPPPPALPAGADPARVRDALRAAGASVGAARTELLLPAAGGERALAAVEPGDAPPLPGPGPELAVTVMRDHVELATLRAVRTPGRAPFGGPDVRLLTRAADDLAAELSPPPAGRR